MKQLFLALALVAMAPAHSNAVNFTLTGEMNRENHGRNTWDGDWDQYSDRAIYFSDYGGREILSFDWLEVDYRPSGLSYQFYSYGYGELGGISPGQHWSFGHGTMTADLTVSQSGLYRISAYTNMSSLVASRPFVHKMLRADGSAIFDHTESASFAGTVFLEAGTYSTQLAYDTYAPPDLWGTYAILNVRFSVQAVPEPGTMLAMGAGLVWFAKRRR